MALCKRTHDVISYFLSRLVLIKWCWLRVLTRFSQRVTTICKWLFQNLIVAAFLSHDEWQCVSFQLAAAAGYRDGIFKGTASLSLTSLDKIFKALERKKKLFARKTLNTNALNWQVHWPCTGSRAETWWIHKVGGEQAEHEAQQGIVPE